MASAAQMGIRSILCLLSDDELREFYQAKGIDLLADYRRHGFQVAHVPVPDYLEPALRTHDILLVRLALGHMPLRPELGMPRSFRRVEHAIR